MKLARLFSFICIMLSVYTSSSYAGIITEQWQGTIQNVGNNNGFTSGDIITWSVTYDNIGRIAHSYNDGLNGIAEYGAGDDTLVSTWCSNPGQLNCDLNFNTDTLLSDATIEFGNVFNVLLANSIFSDFVESDGNNSMSFVRDDYWGGNTFSQSGDARSFGSNDVGANWEISGTYNQNTLNGSIFLSANNLALMSTTAATVPVPAALWLFGSGLIGLIGMKRKSSKASIFSA